LDCRITVLEEKHDYIIDISNLNDLIINLRSQIDRIIFPGYRTDISNPNDSIINHQSQIISKAVPDYPDEMSSINNRLRAMYQSITELNELIGDGNDVDRCDINNSMTSLQSQIDNMNRRKLITTRVNTQNI
jgi:hypothetical protein